MIDDESDLRQRFAALRAEERSGVPPFARVPRRHPKTIAWRVIGATAVLLVIVILFKTARPHRATFSDADRTAVRSVAAWHPPTDFLLRTPGHEMLTSTPRIPDLKGIPR